MILFYAYLCVAAFVAGLSFFMYTATYGLENNRELFAALGAAFGAGFVWPVTITVALYLIIREL